MPLSERQMEPVKIKMIQKEWSEIPDFCNHFLITTRGEQLKVAC